MGKPSKPSAKKPWQALTRWPWPGNIRELENFLERAVILTRGPVLYVPLAELEIQEEQEGQDWENPTLQAAEREHILRALREAKGQIGGSDWRRRSAWPETHHAKFQNKEARHRAK